MKPLVVVVAVLVTALLPVSLALAAAPSAIKLPGSYADARAWATGGPQGWAASAISDASLWGIIEGYPDGTFRPESNITRAAFAAMLARAMGMATPAPNMKAVAAFTDIGGQDVVWALPYLQSLSSAGVLTTGMYGTTLGPGGPITRAEAAAWISAGLHYFGVTPSGVALTFADVPATGNVPGLPGSTVVPVRDLQAAAQAGIIKGYPDGTFQPDGRITRAEAATMLTRFVEDLPGYSALERQTPYIGAEVSGVCTATNDTCGWQDTAAHGWPNGQPATILTAADVTGFTPASAETQWQAEPVATWPQVHEWIATQNWISLGEAKLNQDEASYVAEYGLQAYAVAEIAVTAQQYMALVADSPLLFALQPTAHDGAGSGAGSFTPVSSVQLNAPDTPMLGDLPNPALAGTGMDHASVYQSCAFQFIINGAAGIFYANVGMSVGGDLVATVQNANS